MRALALLLAGAALAAAPAAEAPGAECLQAVEFPYYLYPRTQWERELVWLKTIGIRTVEFSIPWNWHQLGAGDYDFQGRTSPRRDLVAFVRTLRKLGLRAWIRPLPPVAGWLNRGTPAAHDSGAERAWLKQLSQLLATQTASHGGPIAYVEGRALAIDAPAPPARVTTIAATGAQAFAESREAIAATAGAGSGGVLWTNVEDALYPAGWSEPGTVLRQGVVGLGGDERPGTNGLRRDAALLRNWAPLFGKLAPVALPKPASGKLPDSISAFEVTSPAASALSITNRGKETFHDEVRVVEPGPKRVLAIPGVTVRPGDSLWLPLGMSIGPEGLCRECANFSGAEHIIYATAELLSIEFENGILAMEFAAPDAGEVILQLARQPVGPYLAAGKPTEFDWDEKTLRARLKIPAGDGPGNRVRIGIAIEEPETSAFFNDARRLIIGQKNLVSTTYSSAEVAKRSRLRLPEGFTATARPKAPNEIDYEVAVPADQLHGDWVNLAIEADAILLGRAHVQLLRPASVRVSGAVRLHVGTETDVEAEPPTAPIEPKAGGNVEIVIHNNDTGIQTYRLEAEGEGLDFFPRKTEISIGGSEERRVLLRVFTAEGTGSGLRAWHLRVTGGASLDLPMRVLLMPRGRTVAWSADLDGDGSPEWILESQKVRAVFSAEDGGRWMEFTWKDTLVNFLPAAGGYAGRGAVEVRAEGDSLEFSGNGWKRTVRLSGNVLTVEQSTPLAPDGLTEERRGSATLKIERPSKGRAVFTLM